jgi:hypothetical protein
MKQNNLKQHNIIDIMRSYRTFSDNILLFNDLSSLEKQK